MGRRHPVVLTRATPPRLSTGDTVSLLRKVLAQVPAAITVCRRIID